MMSDPTRTWAQGWYPSHSAPNQYEYWDGTSWTGDIRAQPPVPPVVAITPARRKLGLSTWIGAGLAAVWLIISLASSGISGFLVGVGVIGFFTGLYVVITRRRSWLRLSGRRAGVVLLAAAVVTSLIGAGIAPNRSDTNIASLADKPTSEARPTDVVTPTARPTPTVKKPQVTTKKVVETQPVPFTESIVDDSGIAAGTQVVSTVGQPGTRTITYRVTYSNGVETARVVESDTVTVAPVNQVVANGTYVEPPPAPVAAAPDAGGGCDGNYSGGCVPIDFDVDCAGGSGDGPSYVSGPVYVVGSDVYRLDRDGDGVACD